MGAKYFERISLYNAMLTINFKNWKFDKQTLQE